MTLALIRLLFIFRKIKTLLNPNQMFFKDIFIQFIDNYPAPLMTNKAVRFANEYILSYAFLSLLSIHILFDEAHQGKLVVMLSLTPNAPYVFGIHRITLATLHVW